MSDPKRVLVATIDFPPIEGGISTLTRETARALAELGYEVTVLAPRPRPVSPDGTTPPFEKGGLGGISVVTFPGYSLGVFRLIPFLWVGVPLTRRNDHILAMNIAYGGVLGWIARIVFGKPYTAYAYAYEFLKYRRVPPLDSIVRHLYNRAARVVAISGFSRDNLLAFGVAADRVVVARPGARLPHAVSPSAIEALRHQLAIDSGPVILSVGRLIPRKRHTDLVHAFSRLLRQHGDAWLVIAGQGPEIAAISRLAMRLGVRDRVVLPGVVDDGTLTTLYALCTVFALPCGEDAAGQVEGFGLVFTEANAHGKPVVGGRSGGVPDAVIDGETGILVEPGDIDALADALRCLLDDSGHAVTLGMQGRARVEGELSWEAFAQAAFAILPPIHPHETE